MTHTRRAWRLIAAKVSRDTHAERELRREVGEGTRDWYELAMALGSIVADELAVQVSEAHWYQIRTRYGVDPDVIDWLRSKCA